VRRQSSHSVSRKWRTPTVPSARPTLKAVYSITAGACRPSINKCESAAASTSDANIYISTKGRLFDYATGKHGQDYALGQTCSGPDGKPEKWYLQGNRLVHQSEQPLLTQRIIYTLTGGGGCTIHVDSKSKHPELRFTTHATVQSCVVVQGLNER
jgi:hypothetical protein